MSGRAGAGVATRAAERAEAERFMRLALEEARKGLGRTSPNPAVGAVLVKGSRVVARGHHARAGGPHAEVVVLRRAGVRARGAVLYTTLEPCNHQGRTPPCTEAILTAGVARVVIGCRDLNPLVSGRGVRRLRAAGLPVTTGVLATECGEVNRPFFTFITEGRPFVTLKVAATVDGKIATATGDSRWVTGDASQRFVHRLRDRVDAILVGAGTVRIDDPQLTARPGGRLAARQPLRVVLSASLDLPENPRILAERRGGVLILTSSADETRAARLRRAGAEVVRVGGGPGGVDLKAALAELARRDVVRLLVEGGAEVFGQFLEEAQADEILLMLAPKVLGEGLSWARLASRSKMSEALALSAVSVEPLGQDVLLRAVLAARRLPSSS